MFAGIAIFITMDLAVCAIVTDRSRCTVLVDHTYDPVSNVVAALYSKLRVDVGFKSLATHGIVIHESDVLFSGRKVMGRKFHFQAETVPVDVLAVVPTCQGLAGRVPDNVHVLAARVVYTGQTVQSVIGETRGEAAGRGSGPHCTGRIDGARKPASIGSVLNLWLTTEVVAIQCGVTQCVSG